METESTEFKIKLTVPSNKEVTRVVVKRIEGDKVILEYEQQSKFKNGQVVSINGRPAILSDEFEDGWYVMYAILRDTGYISYDVICCGEVTEATADQVLLLLDALQKDGYYLLPNSKSKENIPSLDDLVYHIVLDNEGFGYKEEKWQNTWKQRYALHKGTILLSQEEVRAMVCKLEETLRGS